MAAPATPKLFADVRTNVIQVIRQAQEKSVQQFVGLVSAATHCDHVPTLPRCHLHLPVGLRRRHGHLHSPPHYRRIRHRLGFRSSRLTLLAGRRISLRLHLRCVHDVHDRRLDQRLEDGRRVRSLDLLVVVVVK